SFLFSAAFKRRKENTNNTHLLLSTIQNLSLYILFTVSLPPKRDAKVGKLSTHTNYNALLFTIFHLTCYFSSRKT
ncbi:hypothetical protein, partial [Pedobacter nyackensis]|uniref:hypothetical protein n=1 Tax=Pedobacter nyackensis TaxID=475255 RepID=UPI00292EE91A